MHKLLPLVGIFFFVTTLSAQTSNEIKKYVNEIDDLKATNKLDKLDYSEMSPCGGGVHGFFLRDELVLIDATYAAELGYETRTVYFKNEKVLFISYRQHFAEWEKYETRYPKDKYKFDESKMTYTDTLYTVSLSPQPNYLKSGGSKIVSRSIDQKLLAQLLSCVEEMRNELEVERKQN